MRFQAVPGFLYFFLLLQKRFFPYSIHSQVPFAPAPLFWQRQFFREIAKIKPDKNILCLTRLFYTI